MTGGASSPAPGDAPVDTGVVASFFRRQLVLAAVAGAVLLSAVAAVALAVPDAAGTSHATLRMGADGRVTPVSPLGESSRAALWAAVVALLAVAVVLTLVLDHMWQVARFAVLGRRAPGTPRRHRRPPGTTDQEIRDRWQ